jgi:hypothetical protein
MKNKGGTFPENGFVFFLLFDSRSLALSLSLSLSVPLARTTWIRLSFRRAIALAERPTRYRSHSVHIIIIRARRERPRKERQRETARERERESEPVRVGGGWRQQHIETGLCAHADAFAIALHTSAHTHKPSARLIAICVQGAARMYAYVIYILGIVPTFILGIRYSAIYLPSLCPALSRSPPPPSRRPDSTLFERLTARAPVHCVEPTAFEVRSMSALVIRIMHALMNQFSLVPR